MFDRIDDLCPGETSNILDFRAERLAARDRLCLGQRRHGDPDFMKEAAVQQKARRQFFAKRIIQDNIKLFTRSTHQIDQILQSLVHRAYPLFTHWRWRRGSHHLHQPLATTTNRIIYFTTLALQRPKFGKYNCFYSFISQYFVEDRLHDVEIFRSEIIDKRYDW